MRDQPAVGVAGLGFLGRGIATCFLGHGFAVIGYDSSATQNQEALRHIERGIGELIDHAGFPAELALQWPSRYRQAASLAEFSPCDFVVESVSEDVGVKRAVFEEIEAAVGADVPIASNTSAIPISLLQAQCKNPARVVGMHWAEPAHATRFLEVMRGEQTSDATLAATLELARRIGKEPSVVAKDVAAFLVNRMAYAMYREAVALLESGVADVESIDLAFRNAVGLWAGICGPLRWIDLTGGPALYAVALERVLPTLCNETALPKTLRRMIDEKALGVANGQGFYSYTPAEAKEWEELMRKHVWSVRREMDECFPIAGPPDS